MEHAPANHWQFEILPLESRPISSTSIARRCDDIRILHNRTNGRVDQQGRAPRLYLTFAVMAEHTEPFLWCGQVATRDSLLVFPSGSTLEAVGPRIFDVHMILIPEGDFVRYTEPARSLLRRLSDSERPQIALEHRDIVLQLKRQASRLVTRREERASAESAQELSDDLASALHQAATAEPRRTAPGILGLLRAVHHARTCAEDAPQVSELCEVAGTKERNLRYAFDRYLGMSPKAYIQAVRLESVKRELISAGPAVRISDVANAWGFWHLGQFAADYRSRFGELPTQTVERSRTRAADRAIHGI